ncbi:MAG: ASC-1-like protein [Caudoviricetes sp.]|nr:MAG: ASC-1-like protein [Caudoviricetes sp.]
MKNLALTIRQPWAWAIFEAGKNIENRTWSTGHRAKLWIHTSKQLILNGYSMKAEENRQAIAMIYGISEKVWAESSNEIAKATGAIIGSVDLVGIKAIHRHPENPWHMDGQYGWELENPVLLDRPIFCKGQLGLWDCSEYL